MRKKTSYLPYISLILLLFFLKSIPSTKALSIKKPFISSGCFFYQRANSLKTFFLNATPANINNNKPNFEQTSQLQMENALLHSQLNAVTEWLLFEQRLDEQVEKINILSKKQKKHSTIYWKDFFQRRSEELKNLLEMQMQSLPARIIFREPSSWGSSIWINIGEKNNENLGKLVVAKNSPVVIGNSLIGIVEQVEKKKSRVRLITDSGLTPAVRAVRGQEQDSFLKNLTSSLLDHINSRTELFENEQEMNLFLNLLLKIKENLAKEKNDYFLAKGELYGASHPLWKSKGNLLKGAGFNYDYDDIEGANRDLKTGISYGKDKDLPKKVSIIEKGDLLITSGLDGIFPPGLHVATVSHIDKLKDGDFAYNILAKPTATDLDNINVVFVMPPLLAY
jgi:rod shape-determining protein MreC